MPFTQWHLPRPYKVCRSCVNENPVSGPDKSLKYWSQGNIKKFTSASLCFNPTSSALSSLPVTLIITRVDNIIKNIMKHQPFDHHLHQEYRERLQLEADLPSVFLTKNSSLGKLPRWSSGLIQELSCSHRILIICSLTFLFQHHQHHRHCYHYDCHLLLHNFKVVKCSWWWGLVNFLISCSTFHEQLWEWW